MNQIYHKVIMLIFCLDMMMFFHGGYNETILFEGWTIDSIGKAFSITKTTYTLLRNLSSVKITPKSFLNAIKALYS